MSKRSTSVTIKDASMSMEGVAYWSHAIEVLAELEAESEESTKLKGLGQAGCSVED